MVEALQNSNPKEKNYMQIHIYKYITICLAVTILALSPSFLLAQQKFLGELLITKNSSEGFVTVNSERVITGRSITSPSLISTSPQATAKISLSKTGNILLSPDSKLNLSFINSSISMDIASGEVTIETVPNTSLNLFTPDGNLTLPIENQANIIRVKVVNGKTLVQTLAGKAKFNSVLVSAGEFYPLAPNSDITSDKSIEKNNANDSKSYNPLLIVALLGGVGAIVLVALSSSSGNDTAPIVSPTR